MKILIIRLSSIGDIVLTSPVVRCLHLQTKATLHFLTKPDFVSLVQANPYISKVWAYQKGIAKMLKQEKFDYVIDLHKNMRTLQLRWALGSKSFSFPKLNWQKWLLVNLKINRMPQNVHIVDRYMQSLTHWGVKNDGQGLDYFIPDNQQIIPNQLDPKLQNYLVLVVGAAHATKAIPPEQLLQICAVLSPQPIALIGGKAEAAIGSQIAEKQANVINLCGQLSLHQSASVIAQSRLVIAPDTGMMHIAAALRRPIISVWGSTVPAFGMSPYYPRGVQLNTYVENTALPCRPCSKIGFESCPKGHFRCMLDIDIAAKIKQVLSGKN